MAKLAWKPWHKVVELRKDLRSAELPLHMFAADLYDVMMKQGDIYLIQKGDIVSNKSTQAEVEFETKIETGSTTSQLISGEAVLKVKK